MKRKGNNDYLYFKSTTNLGKRVILGSMYNYENVS